VKNVIRLDIWITIGEVGEDSKNVDKPFIPVAYLTDLVY